jgi:uncharacterized protein YrrD
LRSTKDFRGVQVLSGKRGTSRIGKVRCAVFHPQTYDFVGYMVKRPDLAFIKARDDRFLAFDSLRVIEGKVVGYADSDAWDQAACKRLKLDFDNCLLLENMPIASEDGKSLGVIVNIRYDELTGKTLSIEASDGVATKALLGAQDIPRELLLRYADGCVLVASDALDINLSGGLAAKAGAGAAIAGNAVRKVTSKAGARVEKATTDAAIKIGSKVKETAGKAASKNKARQQRATASTANAIGEGARAVGRQLGKSKGMFGAFKNEYKKAAASGKSSAKARSANGKGGKQGRDTH